MQKRKFRCKVCEDWLPFSREVDGLPKWTPTGYVGLCDDPQCLAVAGFYEKTREE